mgnify:CR=1 FL=1
MTENLIIFNTRVVTPIGFSARRGREMEELCIIDNATVEVTDGIITYVTVERSVTAIISTTGITMPAASVCYPALWTHTHILCLVASVPRSSPGV